MSNEQWTIQIALDIAHIAHCSLHIAHCSLHIAHCSFGVTYGMIATGRQNAPVWPRRLTGRLMNSNGWESWKTASGKNKSSTIQTLAWSRIVCVSEFIGSRAPAIE